MSFPGHEVRRPLPAAVRATAVLIALLFPAAARPAAALAVPDSTALTELRNRIANEREIRVVGSVGSKHTWIVPEPILDLEGIRSARWEHWKAPRSAIVQTRDVPVARPPERIAWESIAEIQVSRRPTVTGLVGGLALGTVVGLGASLTVATALRDVDSEGVVNGVLVTSMVGGLVVGALIRSWRRIVP